MVLTGSNGKDLAVILPCAKPSFKKALKFDFREHLKNYSETCFQHIEIFKTET